MKPAFTTVGVVGAGAMGNGIAQLAAQAGSQVLLLDIRPGAAEAAIASISGQWDRLVAKDRMSSRDAAACHARLKAVDGLGALRDCDLVIEAIV